ncbi:MAG TPA: Gfo/Idh/MocA family oxidoreductase, partial [Rhodoglobus sp.]|nr:Gfo/Idh/MocA family oxidoreductase [Rhodoglobus sp.]
ARAAAFAREHDADVSGGYDVVERDDVDAVYIGTVHTTHVELALRALAAGKAVLCEKPVTVDAAGTDHVLAAAAEARRPFLEAYKYRFTPLWAELLRRLPDVGAIRRVEAQSGFAAGSRGGRLFDPALGGGAILDVGGYPVSLVVGLLGAGVEVVRAEGSVSAVDEHAEATLRAGAARALVETSITRELPVHTLIEGEAGTIEVPNVWGSRSVSGSALVVDGRFVEVPAVQPMGAEADAVALVLAEGRVEAPEMPWAQSAAIARVLGEWRGALR